MICRLYHRVAYGRWAIGDRPTNPGWHWRRRRLIRWLKEDL